MDGHLPRVQNGARCRVNARVRMNIGMTAESVGTWQLILCRDVEDSHVFLE